MSEQAVSGSKTLIEGGVDAIVIGAGADGLAAAAYLARAGLSCVLLEAAGEKPVAVLSESDARVAGDAVDGEHLFYALDPQMIEDLDLYRFGVSFAARRLATTYFFEDGDCLQLGGDLRASAIDAEPDGEAFAEMIAEAFGAAAMLRPLLTGPIGAQDNLASLLIDPTDTLKAALDRFMNQSAEEVIGAYLPDGVARAAMLAEAAFRNGVPPYEPMSFSPMLARWSGEVSGLQGAHAFATGGAGTVIDALRRAAQKAKVEFRAADPVTRILIEKDCAAGVEFESGNQLRAPVVVSALDAHTTFMDLIGPSYLDRRFQHSIMMRKPPVASVHLQLVLKDDALVADMRADVTRRNVYAPPIEKIRAAFVDAGNGDLPEDMILEAVFLNGFDEEARTQPHRLSVIAHPAPNLDSLSKADRKTLRNKIIAGIEKMAPGIGAQIETAHFVTAGDLAARTGAPASAFAARECLARQLARAAVSTSADTIGGLYFCGPEAQIGHGVNGAAGRNAAAAALHKAKRAGAAP